MVGQRVNVRSGVQAMGKAYAIKFSGKLPGDLIASPAYRRTEYSGHESWIGSTYTELFDSAVGYAVQRTAPAGMYSRYGSDVRRMEYDRHTVGSTHSYEQRGVERDKSIGIGVIPQSRLCDTHVDRVCLRRRYDRYRQCIGTVVTRYDEGCHTGCFIERDKEFQWVKQLKDFMATLPVYCKTASYRYRRERKADAKLVISDGIEWFFCGKFGIAEITH